MRASAGVILVRPPGRVYLVRRGPDLGFLPGFHAFPGGVLESGDEQVEVISSPLVDTRLVACAARELAEEAGLDLQGRPVSAELRRRLLERQARLPSVNARALWLAGVRITPPYMPFRFRTQFFMLALDNGAEPEIWPGELTEGRWWEVEEALSAWEQGRIFLVAPTLGALLELREHPPEEAARRLEETPPGTGLPGPAVPLLPGLGFVVQDTATLPPARVTLTCLVGGERVLVVDPGSAQPQELARLRQALDQWERLGRRPVEIVLTHHHPDHVQGVPVARNWGLPVAAHRLTAERLPFEVDRLVDEGEPWDLGQGWNLQALWTPGHAPGHLCLWDPARQVLLAGDLTAGFGSILIDPEEGSMADYLASLRRIQALRPRLVVSSHGPPVGPGADLAGRLLAHRLERESRVLGALASQPRSLDDLLGQAYSDADAAALPLARRSLLAHLLKLRDEGRASQAGADGWCLCGPE